MKNVKDIINELNQVDPEWGEFINSVEELDEIYNNTNGELLGELIEIMRSYVKNQDKKQIEEVSEWIGSIKVTQSVLRCVDKTLIHYNNLEALREIEKEDSEIVGKFLQDAIENFVVRVDYEFPSRYADYKVESNDTMRVILKSIDCLTEFYVRRIFTRKAIEEDFCSETGLTKNNCRKYAEIVDRYFGEMKMNILMQDTEYIRQSIGTKA